MQQLYLYLYRYDYECSADGLDRLVELSLKNGALGKTLIVWKLRKKSKNQGRKSILTGKR